MPCLQDWGLGSLSPPGCWDNERDGAEGFLHLTPQRQKAPVELGVWNWRHPLPKDAHPSTPFSVDWQKHTCTPRAGPSDQQRHMLHIPDLPWVLPGVVLLLDVPPAGDPVLAARPVHSPCRGFAAVDFPVVFGRCC